MSAATTAEEKQPIPNQVFVGGMAPETSIEQLTKHFQSLKLVPVGPPTFFMTPEGATKGCALVPFANPDAVTAAIAALNGSKLGEKQLIARPDRGPRKPRRETNQDATYLYVGNLDPEITPQELSDLFASQGKLKYCSISRKRRSDNSLGWATVQLSSEEEAQKAQGALNGTQFKDRVLTVEPLKSIPRPARKPRAPKKEKGSSDSATSETPEQPAIDPCVVWVGNLPFSTTEETLRGLFGSHGAVKDVVITRDKRSKESRGWGTVTFETVESASSAIEKLTGTTLEDRTINVQLRRGPRVRKPRRQPAAQGDAVTGEEGKERKPRRPRRYRTTRRPRGDGEQKRQSEEQGQNQASQTEEKQPKQRRRARRPRNDAKGDQQAEEPAVTIHTESGETEGKSQRSRRPRRRRTQRRPEETGEGEQEQQQQARPRRERKEPARVVENPDCHLYVRNIPFSVTAENLKQHFEKSGSVVSATITVNTKGLSRGWGTVQMGSAKEAQKALELDGTDFQGRSLFVRVDNRVARGEA